MFLFVELLFLKISYGCIKLLFVVYMTPEEVAEGYKTCLPQYKYIESSSTQEGRVLFFITPAKSVKL